MSIWSEAPRIQAPPQDPAQLLAYVKDLANTTAKMAKDLEFILNGNIAFDNIRAGSIETDNLKAGAVTAEKITVNELSAISADLGKITAGEVYGTYIATVEGAVPRCEMSATGNIFSALATVDNKIAIDPNYAGVPALDFYLNGIVIGKLDTALGSMEVVGNGSLIIKAVGGNLELSSTGYVSVESWGKLYNETTGHTLEQDLANINSSIGGLASAIASLESRVTALENP